MAAKWIEEIREHYGDTSALDVSMLLREIDRRNGLVEECKTFVEACAYMEMHPEGGITQAGQGKARALLARLKGE